MNKKKSKIIISFLVITMILLSFMSEAPLRVKADSNYSNYLTSESISVKNDRALILLEESGSSNNYRNYYETSFLFPSKLRDEMYSTDLTTNPSKYYVQQAYLNDLDNDYAFRDVENLGQYESNDYIESYTDIIENSGYYNNTDKDYEYLNPNEDITTIDYLDGYPTDYPNSYQNIDEGIDNYNWIDRNLFFDALSRRFGFYGFSNTSMDTVIQNITVIIVIFNNEAFDLNYDISVDLYSDLTSFDNKIISNFTAGLSNWFYLNYTNVNMTSIDINSLSIRLDCIDLCNYALAISLISIQLLPLILNTLQKSDNNYYNYITDGVESTGLYNAEFSFTNDTIGNPPVDLSYTGTPNPYTVVAEVDGHNKVMQNYDTTATTKNAYMNFASQTTGTSEFWMRVSDDSKRMYWMVTDSADNGVILCTISGNLATFNGVAWVPIINTVNNQWYHIRVVWDSTADTFDLFIDLNQELNDQTYNSAIGGITRFSQKSYSDSNYYGWTDALDFDFSDDYFLNRNYLDANYELNISSELGINRYGNSWDNIESLDLEYTFKSNNSGNLDLYLYNIFSESYDLVDSNVLTNTFQRFSYSFDLNYTYYTTLGLTNFTFYVQRTENLTISIDEINLKAIFSNFSINSNGFHSIDLKFNRKTSGTTNRGNISFNMDLYKNYFTYDYIENNVLESDYSRLNQVVNFSNEIEQIYEVEIQAHIRYGLNTLDIDIVNTYILVLINYNYTFELFEQLRFGNNDGNYFRSEFSYDSMNFNRLNNTGIYGNYSMNCLSGLRVLRADTSQNFNRYFLIPYFDEKISLYYGSPTSSSGTGSEPRLPSSKYWTYETFRLADAGNLPITVENWTVDFRVVEAEKYEAKFFYKEKTLRRSSLGSWTFKIGDIKVSFNFLRNAITDIINLILVFFQYLFYLVTASLSYIFMYLGINIIVLLWNIVIYYIFTALIWILWYIYSGLYLLAVYIWDLIVYVWENYLLPFLYWFWEYGVPIIIDWLIVILAHIITIVIWLITLGEGDYDTIYENVYTLLRLIADEIIAMITVFIENLPYVILFILYYLLLTGMLYIRYLYVKGRGFNNRAEQLFQAFEVFMIPINLTLYLFKTTKDLVDPYTS